MNTRYHENLKNYKTLSMRKLIQVHVNKNNITIYKNEAYKLLSLVINLKRKKKKKKEKKKKRAFLSRKKEEKSVHDLLLPLNYHIKI